MSQESTTSTLLALEKTIENLKTETNTFIKHQRDINVHTLNIINDIKKHLNQLDVQNKDISDALDLIIDSKQEDDDSEEESKEVRGREQTRRDLSPVRKTRGTSPVKEPLLSPRSKKRHNITMRYRALSPDSKRDLDS